MAYGLLILISFFTRIPIGRKIEYNEKNFKDAFKVYTLVGAVIGLFLMVVSHIGESFNSLYVKGLLITLSYIVITGGIHLDGSADTADGIFSGREKHKIFEIMSDPHIGSFGVLCLIYIVLSQFVLFSNVDKFICFLTPIVGKCSIVVSCYNKKYAKESKGMGTLFIESIDEKVVISNLIILIIFLVIVPYKLAFFIAAFSTLVISRILSYSIEKKIGGMTGDTCGFVAEISQIVFMFIYLIVL